MTLVIAWRITKLIEGSHRGLQAYRPIMLILLRFLHFFQNQKNVTFYVFCRVSYVFSNYDVDGIYFLFGFDNIKVKNKTHTTLINGL